MKKVLIISVIEFILLCLLYNYLLTTYLPEEKTYLAVGIISILMMIPLVMINSIYSFSKELSLLRKSENPNLKDGERVGLTGYIRPFQEPLLSPFSKKPCVSYRYEVSLRVSGKRASHRIEYSGHVQIPSTLQTSLMNVRLLGFMEGEPEVFDELEETDQDKIKNAYEYLSSRQFQPKAQSISEAFSDVKKFLTDNDGSLLEEQKHTDAPLDLSGRTLEESCIEINQPYSVVGVWSSEQNGLVSDPFGNGTIMIIKGDLDEATKSIRSKKGCLLFGAIFLILLINVLAYLSLTN